MTSSRLPLDRLGTPSFLVDRAVVEANTSTMRRKAMESGVVFRPHVKTHKTVEIARLQVGGETGPITVSTMAEAEAFATAGFRDITYAVPISPDKLQRAVRLAREIDSFNVLIDSMAALRDLERTAETTGTRLNVFLKIDCGYHRAGVDPDSGEGFELGRAMCASRLISFRGLLTHAGHSYHARNRGEVLPIARQEGEAVTRFMARLAAEGIAAGIIRSTGSTPTMSVVDRFENTDEVRPGNYVFYDAFQAAIGACSLTDCAASVLTSVIGNHPEERKLILDAGALALSKDAGPTQVDPDCGYGVLCDLALRPLPFRIRALSQEHGLAFATAPFEFSSIPIGAKLRIIPNHSCLTAALFDRFVVVEHGAAVDEWKPVRGW